MVFFLRERQWIGSKCSSRLIVVLSTFSITKLRRKLYFHWWRGVALIRGTFSLRNIYVYVRQWKMNFGISMENNLLITIEYHFRQIVLRHRVLIIPGLRRQKNSSHYKDSLIKKKNEMDIVGNIVIKNVRKNILYTDDKFLENFSTPLQISSYHIMLTVPDNILA